MASWIGTGESNPGDVATNGKLGVGISSPDQGLHVVDAGGIVSHMKSSDSPYAMQHMENSSGSDAYIGASGNGLSLSGNAFNSDHVVIDSGGKMGINQTSPSEKLHVNGTIKVDDGTNYGLIGNASSVLVFRSYGAAAAEPIKLQQQVGVTTYDRVTIDASGKVGIRTDDTSSADITLYGNTDVQGAFRVFADSEFDILNVDGNQKYVGIRKSPSEALDVNGNIKGDALIIGCSAPSNPVTGMLYYDTDDNKLYIRNIANDGWNEVFANS